MLKNLSEITKEEMEAMCILATLVWFIHHSSVF